MSIVPQPKLERLAFYEEHVQPWTSSATSIGLNSTLMTAFTPKVTAARAALTAQLAAKAAAKAATEAFDNAMRTLHDSSGGGAELVRLIKNFAESKNDPNVYVLAQIPAPTPPSAVPPPGTPDTFRAEILPVGSVVLSWKCQNPPGSVGTVYEIQRQLPGQNGFAVLAVVGERSFTDETIPAGSSPVNYRVTAARSTTRGTTAEFTVRFGGGSASVVNVRIAA